MNEHARALLLGLAFVSALVGLSWASSGETTQAPEHPEHGVIPVSMDPLRRGFVGLNGAWIYARDPVTWEVRKIPVRLRWTEYQAQLAEQEHGKNVNWNGKITCYELTSEEPYAWAVWTTLPGWLGDFTLFNLPDQTSYMAFVTGLTITLTEVTKPVEPCEALQEHGGPQAERLITCPVVQIVPRTKDWHKGTFANAMRIDVAFKSLAKTPDGGLKLGMTNPQGTDSVTLDYKDGKWQLDSQEATE